MRIADVAVGTEYAHRESSWSPQASRVSVREKLSHGRVRVKVLEPARAADKALRRGTLIEVSSRSLVSTWTAWPEVSAAEEKARDEETAKIREHWEKYEQEKIADAHRRLPDRYDSDFHNASLIESADDLRDWPIPAPRMAWQSDRQRIVSIALRVLKGLPVNLARDLLAAAALGSDHAAWVAKNPDGSVGAVLGPLASTLVDAMDWADRGRLARRHPEDLLSTSTEFVDACAREFAVRGGCLDLPKTPFLEATRFPGPGWMRVAYGYSSGRRQHAPDCYVLKAQRTDPNIAPTWPAWRLNLPGIDPCNNCGGPWVAATPALLGFLLATAVWKHRSDKTAQRRA